MRSRRFIGAGLLRLSTLLSILSLDPNSANAGKQDLISALSAGQMEDVTQIIERLRIKSKKIDWKDPDGNTPLHLLAERGLLELTQKLLDKGARINEQNKVGATPLFLAVFHRRFVIIDALLQAGADAKLARNDGSTPLLLATQYGQLDLARKLIQAGARLSPIQANGSSILSYSLKHHLSNVTSTLLESEVQMGNLPIQEFGNLLITAITEEDIPLLRAVINHGDYNYPKLDDLQKTILLTLIQTHLEQVIEDRSPSLQFSRLGHTSTFLRVLALPDNEALNVALKQKAATLIEALLKEQTDETPAEPEKIAAPRCLRCWDELTEETKSPQGPAHCDCALCLPCSQDLIHLEITSEGASVSRCPGCKKIWDPAFLKQAHKTPEEIEAFKQRLLKRVLAETPHWHFCQTPDCLGGVNVTEESDSKYLDCPICNQAACTECREKFHISGNCETYLSPDKLTENLLREKINKKKFRRCPHCNTLTEKNEGCLHMDCPRCNTRWIWLT